MGSRPVAILSTAASGRGLLPGEWSGDYWTSTWWVEEQWRKKRSGWSVSSAIAMWLLDSVELESVS